MITFTGSVDDGPAVIRFLRREADNLRALRTVVVSADGTLVLDVNKDGLEFPGLTFGSEVLERLLQELGVVFRADRVRSASGRMKFDVSARWTWGHDRVM